MASHFSVSDEAIVRMPASARPVLITLVDTEEEFNWAYLSHQADDVENIRYQVRAHEIFESYKVVPTYLITYPVVAKEEGYKPLLELHQQGVCEIGAHLHPWVNPPTDERVSVHNSFPGNLPLELEREKLRRLTEQIDRRFGTRPTVYRAGRYGLGTNTARILSDLEYQVDMSVLPRANLQQNGGPDFSKYGPEPFWFGPDNALLEIPQTALILGLLESLGPQLYHRAHRRWARTFKVPGILARLRLLERITLTPEGICLSEAQRLTRAMIARGHRVFVLSYHSPSLLPGKTPYVRTNEELRRFLVWLDGYFDFFCRELGGELSTADEMRHRLVRLRHG